MTIKIELSLDDVADALDVLDFNDREVWVQMGMAIKSEFGETGFDPWDNWGARSDKYKPNESRTVWRSFKRGGVGIGTLISAARDNGYEFRRDGLSKDELTRRRQAAEERRKERAKAIEEDAKALNDWNDRVTLACERLINDRLLDDSGTSPYLQAKRVMAFGIYFVPHSFLWITDIRAERIDLVVDQAAISDFFDRKKKGEIVIDDISFRYVKRGTIAVPMIDIDGRLRNFQFIFGTGKKTFPKFGRKHGLFHVCETAASPSNQRPSADGRLIQSDPSVICFAEGYATASSVLQASKQPVVVTFDSGNMPTVAAAFRGVYPDSIFIFCGDDDQDNASNAGRKKAGEAAETARGVAIFPDFSTIQQGLNA